MCYIWYFAIILIFITILMCFLNLVKIILELLLKEKNAKFLQPLPKCLLIKLKK